ncbi:MAG: HTTM domain-containing protein [Proteobacteria bacterium]|nr:HTTM domain-containing protein [Pseudomonadota bacterium]
MSATLRDFLMREGSTRPAGLVRILLALLLWARFAVEFAPYHNVAQRFPVLALLFWISTPLMLIGFRAQLSTLLAGLTLCGAVFYAGVAHGHEHYVHHHVYMLAASTLWLGVAPCGGSYSVDRWLSVRRARRDGVEPPPERGPQWGVTVVLIQLSACYFWSAYDKSTPAFLSGARLTQILVTKYGTSDIPFAGFEWLCQIGAWATVLGEFGLAAGVLFKRLAWLVVPAGLLMHALFFLALPVSTFSLTCMALYLLVVDPDDVHAFLDAIQGHAPR